MIVRFKNIGIAFLIAVMALASTTVRAQGAQDNAVKFGRLLRLVESYYVDSVKLNDLTEKAIVELLRNLDPHSVYISKEEVQKMNEPLQGNFEGVGISFNVFHDTLLVVTTVPGGPSEKVGIRAGDRIVQVDAKVIANIGLKNSDVYDLLRGKKGTKVVLKVKRKGEPNLLEFTVIRDKIPIVSVDTSYMLDDNTGYIKLNKFSATTITEFTDAVKALKEHSKLNNLVLDLRGNGGGFLNAAVDLADQFLSDGKLVVYTSGLHSEKKELTSGADGEMEKGRLVVLIDENSASASEIVAGAIQDWDRGVLIGRRSYGKGLVQQQMPLTDGSFIRLTIAHYYTPSGRCIQKPYSNGVEDYQKDYQHRMENGELFSKDKVEQNKAEKFETKVNKRVVYGGGGIMPDLFIPLDTSKYYIYYNTLASKNLIYPAAIEVVDRNRAELVRKYPDFKTFAEKFEVADEVVDKILDQGEKAGVKKEEKSVAFARPLLKKQIKGLIARDLFTMGEYWHIMNADDEAIKKALEILGKKGNYDKILSGE